MNLEILQSVVSKLSFLSNDGFEQLNEMLDECDKTEEQHWGIEISWKEDGNEPELCGTLKTDRPSKPHL